MIPNYITVAIPNSGRMCAETLEWLADIGAISDWWQREVTEAMSIKKKSNEWEVKEELQSRWKRLEGITLKYDLKSGWRISVSATQHSAISGVPILVYGSDAPTTNVISQSTGEIAIIGFDDLLATLIPYLKPDSKVRYWNELDGAIRPLSTDMAYFRPTGIDDYAGLFLIASSKMKIPEDYLEMVRQGKIGVSLKGQYERLFYYLMEDSGIASPSKNIEEEIKEGYCFGFDVVRTGQTVVDNDLVVIGEPLLTTKSLIAIDKAQYSRNANVMKAANYLANKQLPGNSLEEWRSGLEKKLGERWLK